MSDLVKTAKNDKKSNLVWVDLEMTGLNPLKDKILEIAVIITDGELNIIAEGPQIIISQQFDQALLDPKVIKIHTDNGLFKAVEESKISLESAEQTVLDFVKQYCDAGTAPLCGNSIYNDRFFIKLYMQELDKFLHYRNLDVSSIKEVVKHWYPNNPKIKFFKPESHRALEDIKLSIEELKHYRMNFFISQ